MESRRETNGLGESKSKDERVRLDGVAMARPPSETLRGGDSFRCS